MFLLNLNLEMNNEMISQDKSFADDMMTHALFCIDCSARVDPSVYNDDVTNEFSDWRVSKSDRPDFNQSSHILVNVLVKSQVE